MSFGDHMIERFETSMGVLGYDKNGRLIADHFPDVDRGFCPVWDAIMDTQSPERVAQLFARSKAGDASAIGEYDGANASGIEFTDSGICAELNIGAETYEQTMTLQEFEPILDAWQRAWAAAQEHKKAHPRT